MLKKILMAIGCFFVFIGIWMLGTGFSYDTSAFIGKYSVSEDGSIMTFEAGVGSSMGFVRGYKDEGGGVKPHYLKFYCAWGGLNSSLGAKSQYTLELDPNDTEIYVYRGERGYDLTLQKDVETGEWNRVANTAGTEVKVSKVEDSSQNKGSDHMTEDDNNRNKSAMSEDDNGEDYSVKSENDTTGKDLPLKEEVLTMREKVLEGMSEEEIDRLTENIKVANLRLENAYLKDNIFGKLENPNSLYWNYFDQKGDIQIGWAFEGNKKEIMDEEGLSEEQFYEKYGTPVMEYNRFDAENFIDLIKDMQSTVHHEGLYDDLQQLIDLTALAKETHDMKYANEIYKILHDMDYFLLRYGLEDVGTYTRDVSVVATYYGVLDVYQSSLP